MATAERHVPHLKRDFATLRKDFPALQQLVHGRPLAYLDNAASGQTPVSVQDAVAEQQRLNHSNVHRGVHQLSERSTAAYEGAREKLRSFINASSLAEVVFTRGTTESINLVAASFGQRLEAGDEVLITGLEHHSNIVPWQLLCERTGARLVVAPIRDDGSLDVAAFDRMLGARTRIAAFAHVSNALGTINPIERMIQSAHARGAVVLIDGAQAIPHFPVDVQALDCDFYVFSSHKMFGPTGTGVLYGRRSLLEAMPPYRGGGDMIASVTFEKTAYNVVPYKFEAGTPNMAGVVGLGAAIDYLNAIDRQAALVHEDALLELATTRVREIPGTRIIGEARRKTGVLSFVLDGVHPHDVGTILDREGVAVRTGQHCAQPVMDRFGIAATIRVSLALYNSREDIDAMIASLARVREVFG